MKPVKTPNLFLGQIKGNYSQNCPIVNQYFRKSAFPIIHRNPELGRRDEEKVSDRVRLPLPSRPGPACFLGASRWMQLGGGGTGGSSRSCRCCCRHAVTVRVQRWPERHENNNKKKLEEILKAFLFHPSAPLQPSSPPFPDLHLPSPRYSPRPPETQITSA